jgi:site-specific recombinase XerC
VLTDIEPRVKARVQQLIEQVGENEFRCGVAEMTGFDTDALDLDDVICVYVLAKRGRIGSPEVGRRAAALHQTLPGRTDDDAGFTDAEGRRISKEDWERQRSLRRSSAA